jgi:glycosyltransferase involved in cell wall biosynthesis
MDITNTSTVGLSTDGPTALASPAIRPPRRKTPAARVVVLGNSVTPYRRHVHLRLVREIPEIELWTLTTHSNAYKRWSGIVAPARIRPVEFGGGEPTNAQTQWRYSMREWRKAGRIIRWLRRHDIKAVFCQGCGDLGRLRVIRWCQQTGVPCFVFGDFNICGDTLGGWKRQLKRLIYRRAVDWSYGLMPCGELGRDLLNRYGGAEKPLFWFPFLPDVDLMANPPEKAIARVRNQFQLAPDRRRIVFSARLMKVKRPDLAMDAFAAIADERPNWDLIMLGDGDLREATQKLAPPRLASRIVWTGFLDEPHDVAGIYAQSDVMLLPSDHEPWGVVVVEAAAAGLAIVVSDVVGAAPELVREGQNGRRFARGDLQSLVRTLREVTAPEETDRLRQGSKSVLEQWLQRCDPIDRFREALVHCGVLPGRLENLDPGE